MKVILLVILSLATFYSYAGEDKPVVLGPGDDSIVGEANEAAHVNMHPTSVFDLPAIAQCYEKADSSMAMSECSAMAHDIVDKELNSIYRSIMSELDKAIKVEAGESVFTRQPSKVYKERLLQAQRDWLKSRDSECSVQSMEMLFGTAEGQIYSGCIIDQIEKRIQWLKSFQEKFIVSNPNQ